MKLFITAAAGLLLGTSWACAHQPRIVSSGPVAVEAPEISKGYYDTLDGAPRSYVIDAPAPFRLYLNLLVPKTSNPEGRYSAQVYGVPAGTPVASLDGTSAPWTEFHEKYAGDTYYKGPELSRELPAGKYRIEVAGSGNRGKYVLAVGEKEDFTLLEIANALRLIPELKKDFFRVSPVTFLFSVMGAAYLAAMLIAGVVFGFLFRSIYLNALESRLTKNIGSTDRFVRLAIALALLGVGLFTWHPLVLFLSGFVFFEALTKWCAFYAMIGRSTCPM